LTTTGRVPGVDRPTAGCALAEAVADGVVVSALALAGAESDTVGAMVAEGRG
jgi:hypothetical protein